MPHPAPPTPLLEALDDAEVAVAHAGRHQPAPDPRARQALNLALVHVRKAAVNHFVAELEHQRLEHLMTALPRARRFLETLAEDREHLLDALERAIDASTAAPEPAAEDARGALDAFTHVLRALRQRERELAEFEGRAERPALSGETTAGEVEP